MLLAEKAVDQYFGESLGKWNKTEVIKIGDLGKKFSLNIFNNLQEKVNYKINNLNQIWQDAPQEDLFMNPDGGITRLTKLMYETNEQFGNIYNSLCSYLLNKFAPNKVIQRHPTIRVNATSSFNNFIPYWHSDLLIGHPVGTLNIWIPFTDPHKDQFNGFNICNSEISQNFYFKMREKSDPYQFLEHEEVPKSKILMENSTPVKVSVGEAIVFDSRCFHSAVPMIEHSRVSMDIRIIDKKFLESPYPTFQGLGRKKAKFDLENYYKEHVNF